MRSPRRWMPATLWGAVMLLCATCGDLAASVEGRYVRIELPQRATPMREGRILSVAEIQVVIWGHNTIFSLASWAGRGYRAPDAGPAAAPAAAETPGFPAAGSSARDAVAAQGPPRPRRSPGTPANRSPRN